MEGTAYNPNTPGYPQSTILGPSGIDAIIPDVWDTLQEQYGDEYSNEYRLWTRMHGMMIPTSNPNGGRLFLRERRDRNITVGANNGTSGNTLSFNIATGEIETLGGSQYVYPRPGDIIKDMTSNKQGRISTVTFTNSTTVTIVATGTDGGATNWTTPTAGQKYVITGNSNTENSDGPQARATYWTATPYKLQIIREAVSTTDLARGAKLWPVKSESGQPVQYWTSEAANQLEFRVAKMLYTTVWLGEYTANSTSLPTTTNGIWEEVSAGSNGVNVGPDDYVLHLQDLIDLLLENSPKSMNYMGWVNRNLAWLMQDDLYQRFADANIVQTRNQSAKYMFGENATEGMMGMFDFQTVVLAGFGINLRLNKPSWDPIVMGVNPDVNLYANTSFFFPTQAGRDAEGYIARNFMLRYYQIPGIPQTGEQKVYFLQTGALAPIPTNRIMNQTTDAYLNFGLQSANLKQVGYFYKAVGS